MADEVDALFIFGDDEGIQNDFTATVSLVSRKLVSRPRLADTIQWRRRFVYLCVYGRDHVTTQKP